MVLLCGAADQVVIYILIAIPWLRHRCASTLCMSRSHSDHRPHLSSLDGSFAVLKVVVTFIKGFHYEFSIKILARKIVIATIGTPQDSIPIVK